MSGGYAGLRVLDLTQVIAGPFCTRLLSDLGADVVRIESRDGDIMRRLPIAYGTDGSTAFAQYNVGKRSIGIDLKDPVGRELVLRLGEHADVMVENFRPGTLDRLGLGWDVVRERNPRLVVQLQRERLIRPAGHQRPAVVGHELRAVLPGE